MNWSLNLAADLQRPVTHPHVPSRTSTHPTMNSILTPWGWAPGNSARKAARSRRKARAIREVPVRQLDANPCLKPWGW